MYDVIIKCKCCNTIGVIGAGSLSNLESHILNGKARKHNSTASRVESSNCLYTGDGSLYFLYKLKDKEKNIKITK